MQISSATFKRNLAEVVGQLPLGQGHEFLNDVTERYVELLPANWHIRPSLYKTALQRGTIKESITELLEHATQRSGGRFDARAALVQAIVEVGRAYGLTRENLLPPGAVSE